jgi:indole-3-glycerol phosphate synthase
LNILEKILESKKEEVRLLKKQYSISSFESMEFFKKLKLSLIKNLKNKSHLSIIAEIKKASPSKGVIKKDFDHLSIAEI